MSGGRLCSADSGTHSAINSVDVPCPDGVTLLTVMPITLTRRKPTACAKTCSEPFRIDTRNISLPATNRSALAVLASASFSRAHSSSRTLEAKRSAFQLATYRGTCSTSSRGLTSSTQTRMTRGGAAGGAPSRDGPLLFVASGAVATSLPALRCPAKRNSS